MDLVVIGFNQTNEIVFGDFYFPPLPSPLKLKFQEGKKKIYFFRMHKGDIIIILMTICIRYVQISYIYILLMRLYARIKLPMCNTLFLFLFWFSALFLILFSDTYLIRIRKKFKKKYVRTKYENKKYIFFTS